MRRLRSEAEREILTGERYIGAASGILLRDAALALQAEFRRESEIYRTKRHASVAGGIYCLSYEHLASYRELNLSRRLA
ncbi:hypothetical protein [uncultured Campylobacter sp.]|uniref:hypothetical protein n=1 Tax=uncultured Campylobacter sp. TaxID=218934 RepID=UPI002624AB10|nr:hypothetical protein [uncultured Campylobacter sp.]